MFCLKIGTHCILDEMIPNPESDLKIHSWTSLSQKSIHCLFSFETLLLFLDVQLILVLYFRLLYIPLLLFISSSESTKCLYFYLIVNSWIFIHINIWVFNYNFIYPTFICRLVQFLPLAATKI